MELAIAKTVLGADVASLGRNFKVAIFDFPLGGAAILLLRPFGKVLAVEEHDCVRRRLARCVLRAGRAGSNDRRVGASAVVDFPLGVNLGGAGGCQSSDGECGEKIADHERNLRKSCVRGDLDQPRFSQRRNRLKSIPHKTTN